ncbi:hypothetical protein VN0944_01540 [Helicobacter pylori]
MNRAKLENKPFYIFIDEAKSVIENPIMLAKIKDTLAQARKLNGVLTLAFQDINQLDGVESKVHYRKRRSSHALSYKQF